MPKGANCSSRTNLTYLLQLNLEANLVEIILKHNELICFFMKLFKPTGFN